MKRSRFTLTFILLSSLTFSTFASATEQKTVHLVADEWCPYNCAPGTEAPGILIEIAQKALKKENIDVIYETVPWARAIEKTRQGDYDGIIGAAINDAPDFIFPETPQFTMQNGFYTSTENNWSYTEPSSLNSISLSVIKDYAYSDEIDAYILENAGKAERIQISAGDNALETNIKKVASGRVTALIEDINVMSLFLRDNPEYKTKLRLAGRLPENPSSKIHIAFSPKKEASKHYAELIAKETQRLIKTGEMEEITKKYIGHGK